MIPKRGALLLDAVLEHKRFEQPVSNGGIAVTRGRTRIGAVLELTRPCRAQRRVGMVLTVRVQELNFCQPNKPVVLDLYIGGVMHPPMI